MLTNKNKLLCQVSWLSLFIVMMVEIPIKIPRSDDPIIIYVLLSVNILAMSKLNSVVKPTKLIKIVYVFCFICSSVRLSMYFGTN